MIDTLIGVNIGNTFIRHGSSLLTHTEYNLALSNNADNLALSNIMLLRVIICWLIEIMLLSKSINL